MKIRIIIIILTILLKIFAQEFFYAKGLKYCFENKIKIGLIEKFEITSLPLVCIFNQCNYKLDLDFYSSFSYSCSKLFCSKEITTLKIDFNLTNIKLIERNLSLKTCKVGLLSKTVSNSSNILTYNFENTYSLQDLVTSAEGNSKGEAENDLSFVFHQELRILKIKNFSILQSLRVYPNYHDQFNSLITIGCQLPVTDNGSLSVYNLIGGKLNKKTFINFTARFRYPQLEFTKYPTEIYLFKLELEKFS